MARLSTSNYGSGNVRFLTPVHGEWWKGAKLSIGIIIANFVIWFLIVIGEKFHSGIYTFFSKYFAISTESTFQQMYLWTLVTYAFLHYSFMHLFYNMLFLFFFAPQVERDFGPRKFIIYYLITAIGAALISILVKVFGQVAIPTIGASGAVMGILVAYAMMYPYQTVYVFGMFPIKVRTLIIIVVVIQLAMAFQDGAQSSTDYGAHLGGLATGFVYMKFPNISSGGSGKPRRKARNWRGEETGEERSYFLEL